MIEAGKSPCLSVSQGPAQTTADVGLSRGTAVSRALFSSSAQPALMVGQVGLSRGADIATHQLENSSKSRRGSCDRSALRAGGVASHLTRAPAATDRS